MYYVVSEGRARVLDRLNVRDRGTYGVDWIVFPATSSRDAVRQWRLFKAGTHPRQGELELEVSRYRARQPDYAPVWEAEPDVIASQAARDLAVVEAQQDALAQEQAALEDVRENLSRATRLGARKPARTRPPSRPPRKTAKRRKRAS
jgi:hypothetical protein